jgi:aminopeptidase-like protein
LILQGRDALSDATMRSCEVWPLIEEIYPICRSITGNGVRETFDHIERRIALERTEIATGVPVFDWEIPKEWNIRDAYVADSTGRRVIDFRAHNLHILNYSVPVRRTMMLDELQPHLYSLPEHPDWIPYRTSYYRENWGFSLRHRDRERLGPGPYEVVIDSTLAAGSLTYAEHRIEGRTKEEALIYTHVCHPSLANDNLTGIAAAVALAQSMKGQQPRLTWRFVFGPGTIGSLSWLAKNEHSLRRIRCGLVIGLLGDSGPLTYKRSRLGETATDCAAEHALRSLGLPHRVMDFEPYGYDERQFCSPGIDLPIGRLTRTPNDQYPEYHSSADNLDFVRPEHLAESLHALGSIVAVLDENRRVLNLSPKGEPRLGRRGLYGNTGGTTPGAFEHALLWVLSLSDGSQDLLAIARRSGLAFSLIAQATTALEQVGLVESITMERSRPRSHGTEMTT